MYRVIAVALFATLASARPVRADVPLFTEDTWKFHSCGCLAIDGGLVFGFPAALPTGVASGIGGGFTYGHMLAWGARASWSRASDSSLAWAATQDEFRLRLAGSVQHSAGRGMLALRLSLGTTVVHEDRMRNQGMRAGLTGSALETTATSALPAGELEAVVGIHVRGPWIVAMSGGPSIDVVNGAAHAGWTAELGVAWQP